MFAGLRITDRHEPLVRYEGRHASRTRGTEREHPEIDEREVEPATPSRQATVAVWSRRIRKVYEADPLACPKCGGAVRVIALIANPAVIERNPSWLGLWEPPAERRSLSLAYSPVPAAQGRT